MQCPSCRFENIPGLTLCGRCGSLLELTGAAIDVHPPRASRRALRTRRWVQTRRCYQARDAIQDTLDRTAGSLIHDLRVPLPEPEIAPRLIVPGWAHIHSGLVLRGRTFLGVYLTLLALGLLFWGIQFGAICLGLAFSVHVSSVLDVLNRQGTVRFPSMILTSVLAACVLGILVYWPIGWAASHIAAVREYNYDSPLFQRSDVVLFNDWAFLLRDPRPGDVVLYESNFATNIPAGNAFHMRFVVRENEAIERIVGGPGDHVLWDHGTLTINGSPVAWTPLMPERLPDRLEITVPESRLFDFSVDFTIFTRRRLFQGLGSTQPGAPRADPRNGLPAPAAPFSALVDSLILASRPEPAGSVRVPRFDRLEFEEPHERESERLHQQRQSQQDERHWLSQADEHRRRGLYENSLRYYSRALELDRSLVAGWVGQVQMLIFLERVPRSRPLGAEGARDVSHSGRPHGRTCPGPGPDR